MMWQRTIQFPVSAEGVGVHSGKLSTVSLLPAPKDSGIVFRLDGVLIPASAKTVVDTRMCTVLGRDGKTVATVEHLLSAVAGLGIDNLTIDISDGEVPVMDGSAGCFVFLLKSAGMVEQKAPKRFIRMREEVRVEGEQQWASLKPHFGFRLSFEIDFSSRHPWFTKDNQSYEVDFSSVSYIHEVARARTFGFVADLEKYQSLGLAMGSSLENTLAFDETSILNTHMRMREECVRHKLLDSVGDLYLIGAPILGSFESFRGGHALNYQLIQKVLSTPSSFSWETFTKADCPIVFESSM